MRLRVNKGLPERPVLVGTEAHCLNREVIPALRELQRALTSAPAEFSWLGGNATLDVGRSQVFVPTLSMTEDCSLVLSNGQDGTSGTFFVVQDGSGGHELTVTADGRTNLRPDPDVDDFPDPAPNTVTAYDYLFVTIDGTQYLVIGKRFML